MVEARKVWQSTHDAGKTLNALRGFHCTERQLLQGLKQCAKNDVVNALSAVRTTLYRCVVKMKPPLSKSLMLQPVRGYNSFARGEQNLVFFTDMAIIFNTFVHYFLLAFHSAFIL